MREVRTEEDDVSEIKQEDEEEKIELRKVIITIILFAATLVVGYLSFLAFDYFDTRNETRNSLQAITNIENQLNNPAPINIEKLENFEFDLNNIKIGSPNNKQLIEKISQVTSKLENHQAIILSGSNIYSWATSAFVRAEIDTLILPFGKHVSYRVKNIYVPVTETERRAYTLLKSHPIWGKEECISIASGKVWVGMSKEQLLLSKGQPLHVDKSYTGSTHNEQWAYGNLGPYYYLENGILTSWQQ